MNVLLLLLETEGREKKASVQNVPETERIIKDQGKEFTKIIKMKFHKLLLLLLLLRIQQTELVEKRWGKINDI